VPPDEIADLDVEMTVVAGEIAWPPSAYPSPRQP